MNIEARVKQLVEEKIADRPELFLVDIIMHSNNQLIIFIDGDEGISITDCAAVSRHVGFYLEEENTIEEAYNLEVSSPGIDLPLLLHRQYKKNIGRKLSVKQSEGKISEGKLLEVKEEGIILAEEIKAVRKNDTVKAKKAEIVEKFIPFDQITETKVLISFK